MVKNKKPVNWRIIFLGTLLAGLTIWSLSILIRNTRINAAGLIQTTADSNEQSLTDSSDILVVGGDDSNPPYSYLENGQAMGLDNDLMREIAANLGIQIKFDLSPLSEVKQNLIDGKVDVINGMVFSAPGDESLLYSTPHAILNYDVFVRRNSGTPSLANFSNKTIIIQNGDPVVDYLKSIDFPGQTVFAESPLEALTWLASGRYDGALIGKIEGYYIIKKYHLVNIKGTGQTLNETEYGFAVLSDDRDLLLKLDQALGIVGTSGAFEEISSNWLSAYQQTSFIDKNEYYIYGIVILLAVILIIILWGWSLRRQVKRRTAELNESEKKYRQLISSATEGIVIIVDMRIKYFNPQVKSIFDFSGEVSEEQLNLLDHIHPSDQELVAMKYHQFMEDISVNSLLSFRILTANGDVKWVKSNTVKIDWEGNPALLSFISDITEERKLEESIKTSEERYRLIFGQSPVGMFYYDTDLHITNVNDRFSEIMGLNRIILQGFDLNTINNPRLINALKITNEHETGYFEGQIQPFMSENQPELFVKLQTTPMFGEKHDYQGGIGLLEDITEQVLSEHKIQNLEEKFSKVFFTSPDAINITDLQTGRFIDVNRGFIELTGYTKEEVIGKTSEEINIWANPKDRERLIKDLRAKGESKNLEAMFRTKDGQVHAGLMSSSIIDVEGSPCVLSITRDIEEIKKSNEIIQNTEKRYRKIFESVPVSIWEQDLLEVYDMLEKLRKEGVENLAEYMEQHPDFVDAAVKSVKIIDVNDASLQIYKAATKEDLILSLDKIFNNESVINFKNELLAIWNHETFFNGDSINVNLEGESIPINIVMSIPTTREGFKNVLVSISDIQQRKIAEDALLKSESRYRQLVEQIKVVVYLDYAVVPSRPKYISPQIESLLGYTQAEWMADPELMMKIVHPDDLPQLIEADIETDKSGDPFEIEYRAFTRDGKIIWIHDEAVLVYAADGKPDDWHGVMYDITARKMAEEALRESENRYRTIFNSVPVSIKEEDFSVVYTMLEEVRQSGVTDFEEYLSLHPEWIKKAVASIKINEVNLETLRIYRAESKNELLNSLSHYFTDESYSIFEKELMAFWNHQSIFQQETVNQTLTGEKINLWISIAIPSAPGDYSRILVTIMDITERKKAEEQIRLQVRYLAALRAVDMAISASMDLPITLRVLLNQVHQQLLPDAVSILTLDPHTQTLRYAAGIGFETNAIETTSLRLGQSYAGQAALERRIITADDLATGGKLIQTKDFDREGFTHYLGIPLVSKGTVKGVLELFNHGPLHQDSAWMGLLESMAGQAAIAIENATLMDEVQKININLRSAYDATIEGWARSIDLSTGDIEGHSKHLAELTIELAQSAGFQGEGLLNLRRGALLHDIGKLGIPDSILMKPDSLTDEEWKIMKTHPVIARNLLTSIDFLQSAMEIPCSHHEHWDGSGYPEGLAGIEIPFAARVFAVVDCWETLRSDRPWRKAWTDGNAWEYIETNSGTLFDPQIVEKFRQLLGHGFAAYF